MRLQPIDKPTGLMMRIAFWATRREFGKVMTTMKVMFPRAPKMVKLFYEIQKFETKGMRLEKGLHFMVASLVSQINGCACCTDIARSMVIREELDMEKLNAILQYGTSSLFSNRERAALAFAEEATPHRRVSHSTFEALRDHFTEWEIVEITWLNAVHNYYNLLNVPLEVESDGLCAIAEARMARLAARSDGSSHSPGAQ
jgi:alkylhydroperoxidase family enzyme